MKKSWLVRITQVLSPIIAVVFLFPQYNAANFESNLEKPIDQSSLFFQARAILRSAHLQEEGSGRDTATMLVMDVSGSMSDPWQGGVKIDSAKSAANQIVNMIQQEAQLGIANHQVGISIFSNDALLHLALTDDFALAHSKITELSPQAGTNIGAGIDMGNQGMQQANSSAAKIMILLSDGMSNSGLSPSEIIAGPVQQAVQMGTCIYTVGFGDPGNLDENLLREIAAASGCGEYYYATSVSELEKIYILIRHQSTGTILAKFQGEVTQGDTVPAGTVNVPPAQSEIAISLHWPGSEVELIVHDPTGRILDQSSPDLRLVKYANLVYALITQPVPGAWLLEVFGKDIPTGTETYDIIVSGRQAPITPTPTFTPVPTITPTPTLHPPSPPPTSGGGFPVALLFLLVGGGVIALYVYTIVIKRQRLGGIPFGSGSSMPSSLSGSFVGRSNPRLFFTRGPIVGREVHIRAQSFSVGRGSTNQLQIPDVTVSRLHFVLRFTQGVWLIQDQYSKTGTFVNEQRIVSSRLHQGDRIRIGSTEMIFQTD